MRYAVYFTPEKSNPLTIAAQTWLGRDAFNDEAVPVTGCDGLTAGDLWHYTAEPRRYGFHATLVAPFHLAPNVTEQDLLQSIAGFADTCVPFHIPRLELARLDNFYALAPAAPCPQLDALAWSAVDHFNGLRAPLSDSEIRRRSLRDLSLRQVGYLMRYGYPFVRDEFRFHMTLTNSASRPPERLEAALANHFTPIIAAPVPVDSITLFVERERDAPFTIHSMHRFGSAEAKRSG
jgi:putative phosphonate metabolism protein